MTGDIMNQNSPADPTGAADSTAAFEEALAQSDRIFTSVPGIFRIGEIRLNRPNGRFLTINMEGSELRNVPDKTMFLAGAAVDPSHSDGLSLIHI